MAEYRYRAVREVLGGSPIGEVAARYGTSRQTLHSWRRRFEQEGMPGLLDRSRRARKSPTRLSAEVEAEICELRRRHPRWGARRISHELAGRGLDSAPSRATVPRVLSRGGLVRTREQQHPRKYRRWQREAPMHPRPGSAGGSGTSARRRPVPPTCRNLRSPVPDAHQDHKTAAQHHATNPGKP
ncbi:helix-turn-helix domain-containing protein [Streptomyces sp. NPDC059718]